ncbi:hypothetical protein N658DRAFT_498085 [Parathielavia hyrcaniae]|uniref:Protein kinase domain-containing protein n=1 Tax=Parathielavia hyrcaniae TaxID=113614 RepID=A0AAN6Q2M2_9PEZI|nr:hypothetical protein N658DRAFT_498085 [Parathielavia hyrcaniae]
MDWKPPADPEKPRCPYVAGFKAAVTPHTPPPPFGGGTYRPPGARPADGYDKIKDAGYTQTRYCVKDLRPDEASPTVTSANGANQPNGRPRATPKAQSRDGSPAPTSRPSLVIESVVRGGDKAGAQAVVCHWDNDASRTKYLAKIYDPLYYDFEDKEHRGVPTDVVWHAARDYSVEAAAYGELKAYEARWAATATTTTPPDQSKNIRGCYPAYFGAFAFQLKVVVAGRTYTRTVPLLLTEYLQGPSMAQLITFKRVKSANGRGFNTVVEVPGTDDTRIHAFARAADSYLRLAVAGVMQADFAPRNIFLLGNLQSPTLRAVITDFNVARVFSRMTPPRAPPRLADPITFCADQNWEVNFQHWLPAWFFTNTDKRNSQLRLEFPNGKL